MPRRLAAAAALSASLLAACATLGEKNQTKLTLADTSTADFKAVEAKTEGGLTDYKAGGKPFKAEWIDCRLKKPQATILVMHTNRAGYEKAKFCAGWIAQAFLSQGFDVVAVNRPGYGASTGTPDFSGAQSMAAVQAAVPDALAKAKNPKPLTGAWGYASGASAAALASKHLKGLKFLILGGGLYDYEETLSQTQDDYIKADIEAIKKTGGEKAIEDRSVAYDTSGLPKTIVIYHGQQDTAAPTAQAKAFADSLETSGTYKVNFQMVDGLNHDIPWVHHRKLLEVMAHSVQ